jgi:asparagine synthetase B (glutamine-hydrolysing)
MTVPPDSPRDFVVVVDDRGESAVRVVGAPAVVSRHPERFACATAAWGSLPDDAELFDRVVDAAGPRTGEGPWAGVAWDARRRTLHVIRDPLGHVPLVYMATETRLAVGTSAIAVARAVGLARLPDRERLAAFCLGQSDSATNDFVDDLHRVLPGEFIRFGPSGHNRRLWWDSADPRHADANSKGVEAKRVLEEHLTRTVRAIRGPVTLALSGGVDSALIASFLAERNDVVAVHMTSDRHPSVDERNHASMVADTFRLPLRIVAVDDVAIDRFSPSSHPALFPVTALDAELRRYARGTTLVTGVGSDQLFSDTPSAAVRALARHRSVAAWAREFDFEPSLIRATALGLVEGTSTGAEIIAAARALRPVGPGRKRNLSDVARREPWMKPHAWIDGPAPDAVGPLHRRWEWEEVVRNAWSLPGSAAHPYLDPEIWRWASSLSAADRFARGRDKAVVRDLLARRAPGLEDHIARRSKSQTFNAWAVEALLRADPDPELDRLTELGLLRPTTFANRYRAFQRASKRADARWEKFHTIALWRTFATEWWLQHL